MIGRCECARRGEEGRWEDGLGCLDLDLGFGLGLDGSIDDDVVLEVWEYGDGTDGEMYSTALCVDNIFV